MGTLTLGGGNDDFHPSDFVELANGKLVATSAEAFTKIEKAKLSNTPLTLSFLQQSKLIFGEVSKSPPLASKRERQSSVPDYN